MTKDERARMRAASATWKLSNTMTKAERARMRAASATWKLSNTYHSRTLALLDALDDKDALIAELIAFAETAIATPDYRYDDILPVLAALKARAGE